MELKHTPWETGPHPWPEQIGCCPLVGRPWSVHGTNHHNVAAAVSEDIARLIAAAPDMLEALGQAQGLLNPHSGFVKQGNAIQRRHLDKVRDEIRAAIAKAKGEAS